MINYYRIDKYMTTSSATAIAHPNIALIKYWGDVDTDLHLPANGSLSMNLAELMTWTNVMFSTELTSDELSLNDETQTGDALERVIRFLGRVRNIAGISTCAKVESFNNFPSGVGIAASASGFAALALASTRAAGLDLDEKSLSRLARTGSGSACRSIPGGFVEWQVGHNDCDSYAFSIASPEHWALVDCIALVSQEEKRASSLRGHTLAGSSPLQSRRVADAPYRLDQCRKAITERDFDLLAEVVEPDCNLMHAVMLTSTPPLLYWQPATVAIIHAVEAWRQSGIPVCYTIDAGPNVHVLCPGEQSAKVAEMLGELVGVERVVIIQPGGPAFLDDTPPQDRSIKRAFITRVA